MPAAVGVRGRKVSLFPVELYFTSTRALFATDEFGRETYRSRQTETSLAETTWDDPTSEQHKKYRVVGVRR